MGGPSSHFTTKRGSSGHVSGTVCWSSQYPWLPSGTCLLRDGAHEHPETRLRLEGRRLLREEAAGGRSLLELLEVGRREEDRERRGALDLDQGLLHRVAIAHREGPADSETCEDIFVQVGHVRPSGAVMLHRVPSSTVREDPGAGSQHGHGVLAVARDDLAARSLRSGTHLVQGDAGEDPVDGTEEERGVVVVHDHGETVVPPGPRVLLLEAQVRLEAVVAVRQQEPVQRVAPEQGDLVRIGDPPLPVVLAGAVGELVVRCARGDCRQQRAALRGTAVHQQDRSGVERELAHPAGQVVGLVGVDRLVGQDRTVAQRRPSRGEIKGTDETAHGDSLHGVLVQVERRLGVSRQPSLLLPLGQTSQGLAVGSAHGTQSARVGDLVGGEPEGPERMQASRSGRRLRNRDVPDRARLISHD